MTLTTKYRCRSTHQTALELKINVGQVLEVIGHVPAVAAARVQEVNVVNFTDRRESQMASDLR
jgi:hypothetical protein